MIKIYVTIQDSLIWFLVFYNVCRLTSIQYPASRQAWMLQRNKCAHAHVTNFILNKQLVCPIHMCANIGELFQRGRRGTAPWVVRYGCYHTCVKVSLNMCIKGCRMRWWNSASESVDLASQPLGEGYVPKSKSCDIVLWLVVVTLPPGASVGSAGEPAGSVLGGIGRRRRRGRRQHAGLLPQCTSCGMSILPGHRPPRCTLQNCG